MSQISRKAGTCDLGLYTPHSQLKRSSGTLTRAWLGSIVQKGKFSAGTPICCRPVNFFLVHFSVGFLVCLVGFWWVFRASLAGGRVLERLESSAQKG